ncbi:hypothetical protein [Streptomyces sp. LN785]|uniref:hypothetical protein n=1 Tax=Streptomyces sp. LN785 TaxID=3112983 RepID=UPI003717E4AE
MAVVMLRAFFAFGIEGVLPGRVVGEGRDRAFDAAGLDPGPAVRRGQLAGVQDGALDHGSGLASLTSRGPSRGDHCVAGGPDGDGQRDPGRIDPGLQGGFDRDLPRGLVDDEQTEQFLPDVVGVVRAQHAVRSAQRDLQPEVRGLRLPRPVIELGEFGGWVALVVQHSYLHQLHSLISP